MSVPEQELVIKDGKVQRFRKTSIVFHWLYAAFFLTLVVTGLGFIWDEPNFLAGATGRLIHRIAAVGFMIMPFVYLFGDNRSAMQHLKAAFSWDKDDWGWLKVALPYHFTGRPTPPPQGFLNAGQKMNYLIVVSTFAVFAVTGLIMWFGRTDLALAQRELFRVSVLLHSTAMFVAVAMFLVHVYMSGVHPFTRAALRAMIDGYVSLKYALHEHPKWAEQFVPKGGSGRREEETADR